MSRDFVTAVLGRAMHEDIFLQLLQNDAEAAADAMEMTYDDDNLRTLQAVQERISHLEFHEAREWINGVLQQPQNIFGSPQRPE